jgi:hypothetical protein
VGPNPLHEMKPSSSLRSTYRRDVLNADTGMSPVTLPREPRMNRTQASKCLNTKRDVMEPVEELQLMAIATLPGHSGEQHPESATSSYSIPTIRIN